MPLKITHRNEDEVPAFVGCRRVQEDLEALKSEMRRLAPGMVLQIETDGPKAVRSAKMLVSRAAKQLDGRWQHWNVGTTVFAKPAEAVRRRAGRPRKTTTA